MIFLVTFLALSISPVSEGTRNAQPQLASAFGQVAMTFGAGHSIYYAASNDAGRSFSKPIKVSEAPGLMLGRHRGPRMVILKDALLISAVAGTPGDLVVWRSVDHGNTWTRLGVVNDAPGAAREGLHAMAAGPEGDVFTAWLDLRAKGTQLYSSRSADGGRSWSKNVQVYASPDGTICQCCAPSLAIGEDGKLWAMWRNVLHGSRDLYVASSRDGVVFDSPGKLGTGTWKLNACPMDGGGLVVDKGQPVSAWRRDGQIFLAQPGKPEKAIGMGKDVAIAGGTKGVYVAWSNGTAIEILTPGAAQPIVLAKDGAYVNLVTLPDGSVLAAWESAGTIQTQRVEP